MARSRPPIRVDCVETDVSRKFAAMDRARGLEPRHLYRRCTYRCDPAIGSLQIADTPGRHRILHRATKPVHTKAGNAWQVTDMLDDGTPAGDVAYPTCEAALHDLYGTKPPRVQAWIMRRR